MQYSNGRIKEIFLLSIAILISISSFSQLDDGLYVLHSFNSPYAYFGVSHVIIKKNKFILFSQKPNPKEGPTTFNVNYVGSGTYEIHKKDFIFYFTTESNYIIPPYVNDSTECIFSTDTSTNVISIKLNVYPAKKLYGDDASIVIETPQKTYHYNTKNYSLVATLPPNTIINSIKMFLITYDARILPYDYHFNNLQYNYYLRDVNNVINYIRKDTMQFKIKSKKAEGFIFQSSASLLKEDDKDISVLKTEAGQDANLRKILEFIFK